MFVLFRQMREEPVSQPASNNRTTEESGGCGGGQVYVYVPWPERFETSLQQRERE